MDWSPKRPDSGASLGRGRFSSSRFSLITLCGWSFRSNPTGLYSKRVCIGRGLNLLHYIHRKLSIGHYHFVQGREEVCFEGNKRGAQDGTKWAPKMAPPSLRLELPLLFSAPQAPLAASTSSAHIERFISIPSAFSPNLCVTEACKAYNLNPRCYQQHDFSLSSRPCRMLSHDDYGPS